MKKTIYFLVLLLLISCTQNKTTDLINSLENAEWIDLTYDFEENSVFWPTNVPFSFDTVFYGMTDKGYFYSSFKHTFEEHGGTHFDAPIHFGANKISIEKVLLNQLKGEGIVIDLTKKVLNNQDYLISVEDFEDWEAKNGPIPDGAIVLLYTGHGKYYQQRDKYIGTHLNGPEAVPELHFPGLSSEAATWLTANRNIKAIGLDTPSIDYGQSSEFMAHRILFEHNLTAYENLANLDKLPATGSYIIALPMKIKGGSGAPLRIVAILL